MKLTVTHIGQLFDNNGDGSWVYQLVDVNKTHLLFYAFDGKYVKDRRNGQYDWQPFKPTRPWPKNWLKVGWQTAKEG